MIADALYALKLFVAMARTGKVPSRRAVAAVFKLLGFRPQRRWPFLSRASDAKRNLGLTDLLEMRNAVTNDFVSVIIGAFDGIANDPAAEFVLQHGCRSIFVEPQPDVFAQLEANIGKNENVYLIRAAIDEHSGKRTLYCVDRRPGDGLPDWIKQVASFNLDHVMSHAEVASGIESQIRPCEVRTMSFPNLIEELSLSQIDLLQLDAEGFDAKMIGWFPFELLKPALIHYEAAHIPEGELETCRKSLRGLGYKLVQGGSAMDELAVLFRS